MYLQTVCFSLGTIVARRTVIILITISYYFMYLRRVCFSLGKKKTFIFIPQIQQNVPVYEQIIFKTYMCNIVVAR